MSRVLKHCSKLGKIKMHYGDRPNIELVSYQGFFVPNNPNSFTLVDLSLLAADKLKEKKAEILKKHGLPEYVVMSLVNLSLLCVVSGLSM